MIANPAIPNPGVPHLFTLNDLRMQTSVREPSSDSVLIVTLLALVLALGAFVWLDPMRVFAPTEAKPPAPAIGSSAIPSPPTEGQENTSPLTPGPATQPGEVRIAPAVVGRILVDGPEV